MYAATSNSGSWSRISRAPGSALRGHALARVVEPEERLLPDLEDEVVVELRRLEGVREREADLPQAGVVWGQGRSQAHRWSLAGMRSRSGGAVASGDGRLADPRSRWKIDPYEHRWALALIFALSLVVGTRLAVVGATTCSADWMFVPAASDYAASRISSLNALAFAGPRTSLARDVAPPGKAVGIFGNEFGGGF